MTARGTLALPSVRPFFALFWRPGILVLPWMVAMALFGAGAHLGDAGLAIAFLGAPDAPVDADTLAATAHQLVLHGSALVAIAIGLFAVLQASEVDSSPRFAVVPGFRASMRAGMLLLMLTLPAVVWIWAKWWADSASMRLAMLWMPWWFALGSWGTLLARVPKVLRPAPVALVIVLALQPRLYVAAVDWLGIPGAASALVLAIVAVVHSWSPRQRGSRVVRASEDGLFAIVLDWLTDRSEGEPGTRDAWPRSRFRWLMELRRERTLTEHPERRRIFVTFLMGLLFYAFGTSPTLLVFQFTSEGRTAGRPLMYPFSRRDRARLQYFDQLMDIVLVGVTGLLVYVVCVGFDIPTLNSSDLPGDSPYLLHLFGALAFSPTTQWMRARTAVLNDGYTGTPKLAPHYLRDMIVSLLLFTFSAQTAIAVLWTRLKAQPLDPYLAMGALLVAMQLCCYIGLQWYFRRADLAPTAD